MSITVILAIVSVVSTIVAIFFGRKNVKDNADNEAKLIKKEEELQVKNEQLSEVKKENEKVKAVQERVNRLDSGDAADELRDKWARD